jgi:hypothetical protein
VSALKGGWNAWMEAGGVTEASQLLAARRKIILLFM